MSSKSMNGIMCQSRRGESSPFSLFYFYRSLRVCGMFADRSCDRNTFMKYFDKVFS